jgi:hypothetical protein
LEVWGRVGAVCEENKLEVGSDIEKCWGLREVMERVRLEEFGSKKDVREACGASDAGKEGRYCVYWSVLLGGICTATVSEDILNTASKA